MLLTSHDLGQVETLTDDVVFLLDGRVRFAGPITELLSATGLGADQVGWRAPSLRKLSESARQ